MRGERFLKNPSSRSWNFRKRVKIENYPKIALGAMLGEKVVVKIAKEKVNKNVMVCKHNIKLLFHTILKVFHQLAGVDLSINLQPV